MLVSASGKGTRSLGRQDLARLLTRLGPDRDAAGREYERIRTRLVRFLLWRGCYEADDLADEAINRVARRIAEGLEIESEDPYVYFRGVASKVFQEWRRGRRRDQEAHYAAARETERLRASEEGASETDPDRSRRERNRRDCLQSCLELLPDGDRDLVLRYYQGDGDARLPHRRSLAREYGLSMDQLRLRAFRIRRRLERCIEDHLFDDE